MMVRCIQLRYPASRRALSQMYCLEASGRSDPKQPLLTLCVSQLCQVKLLPRGGGTLLFEDQLVGGSADLQGVQVEETCQHTHSVEETCKHTSSGTHTH